jgi:hypothetical protein
MSDILAIARRMEIAKSLRANWDTTFQEIGDRILPQAASFNTTRTDGEKRTELMFDATAALALQKFSAAIESFATPRNQKWQGLTVTDQALKKSQRVKEYMDAVTNILFDVRYSPRAAFATQTNEAYLAFGAFGTGGVFIDDDTRQRVIRYKSLNLATTWVLENHHGLIDTVFRSFKRTLRQLQQRWPDTFPEKYRQKLEKSPDDMIEVVHFVGPREDYEPSRLGKDGMPWRSCYFLPTDKHELEESGFRQWPFGICRYMTSADEVYGRSPAWLALSNIKVLNEMKRTHLKVGQKLADPPLLASEDGVLSVFSQAPGAMNFGGLDSNGNQLVKPLITGGRLDITMEMMDKEREVIGSAFLADVYRALVENPSMTATQALELISERAVLVAPVLGRLQSEFLGNIIDREIDILNEAGQLPEMPPELIEAQGEYRIEYTSPMSRAMRASDGVAIIRTLEAVTPLAQIDPSVLDRYKLDEAAAQIGEIYGVPPSIMRSAEDAAAMKEGRAEQAQAQQLLDAAPSVSAAAANLTKMQANLGGPVA